MHETLKNTLPAIAAHYVTAADGRPHVAADAVLWHRTAALLATVERATWDGTDDAVSSVIDDAETLARHVAVTTGDRGTFDTLRDAHTWFGDPNHARDAASYTGPAPDWSTIGQSTMTRKRSNSGRTATTVTRHGRGFTVGATGPESAPTAIDDVIRTDRTHAAFIGVRRSSTGAYDGRDLAALTDVLYDVPALIGGDSTSWSEVLPEDVSARVAAGPYNYAAWIDDTAPVSAERKRTARRIVWPTSTSSAKVRPRRGEIVDHVERGETRTDGRSTWYHVRALPTLATTDTDGPVFVGHGPPVDRVPVDQYRHTARTDRVTEAVTIDDRWTLADALGAIAADAERGARIAWRRGETVGTLTHTAGGRYTVRVAGGAWRFTVRTPRGVLAAVRSVDDS